MEKIIYLLWKPAATSAQQFKENLVGNVAANILASTTAIQQLRISAVDDDVAAAAPYRIEFDGAAYSAMIAVWLDTAQQRHAMEEILRQCCPRFAGYLVTESEPLTDASRRGEIGQRSHGMNQVVTLRIPPRLTREAWLDIWLHSHTKIAIETQSTFGYRQNIVARQLTADAPAIDAIVEENFPPAAIADRRAFYDAVGDEEKFKSNQKIMIESCMRFIDFDKIDCIPMSEYFFKMAHQQK